MAAAAVVMSNGITPSAPLVSWARRWVMMAPAMSKASPVAAARPSGGMKMPAMSPMAARASRAPTAFHRVGLTWRLSRNFWELLASMTFGLPATRNNSASRMLRMVAAKLSRVGGGGRAY